MSRASQTDPRTVRIRALAIAFSILMIASIAVVPLGTAGSPIHSVEQDSDGEHAALTEDVDVMSEGGTDATSFYVDGPIEGSSSASEPGTMRLEEITRMGEDGFAWTWFDSAAGTFDPIVPAGELLVVANATESGDRLEAYDADGERQWTATIGNLRGEPVVDDGAIYVSTTSPNAVVAIGADDGEILWSSTDSTPDLELGSFSPAVDEYVYVENDADGVHALDRETGELVWNATPRFGTISAAAEGQVFLVDEDDHADQLIALDGSTGETNWDWEHWTLSGDVAAPPTVHDGILYVPTEGENDAVYAVEADTGFAQWRTPFNDDVELRPAVTDDRIYVASGHTVYALDESGHELASYRTDGPVTNLHLEDGAVYVSSEDGVVYALEEGLTLEWAHALPPATANPDNFGVPISLATVGDALFVVGETDTDLFGAPDPEESLYRFVPTEGEVTSLTADESTTVGETVTATAEVHNHAAESLEYDVTFEVHSPLTSPNDPVVRTETVTVGAGSTESVTTTFSVRTAGAYEVQVFETGTGSVVPATDVGPDPVTIAVTRAGADDLDWGHPAQGAEGTFANPNTQTPTEPIERVWSTTDDLDFEYPDLTPHLVVEDGIVVGSNDTALFGLDLESGAEVWNYTPTFPETYNGESVREERITGFVVDDGTLYFLTRFETSQPDTGLFEEIHARAYAIDATNGSPAWDIDDNPFQHLSHADVPRTGVRSSHPGLAELVVTEERVIFSIQHTNRDSSQFGNWSLASLDREDGGDFETELVPNVASAGIVDLRANDEAILFRAGFADEPYTYALHSYDVETLEMSSARNFGYDGSTGGFRHVVDGDTVYVANTVPEADVHSAVYALDPKDLADEHWNTTTDQIADLEGSDSETHTGIALADGRLITLSGTSGTSYHYSLDAETGAIEWLTDGYDYQPLVGDGVVLSGRQLIDRSSGEQIAQQHPSTNDGSLNRQPVALANGTVLSASSVEINAYREGGALEVSNLTISEDVIAVGETVDVSVTVTNPHESDRRVTVYPDIPGTHFEEELIAAGDERTFAFEFEGTAFRAGDNQIGVRVEDQEQLEIPTATAYKWTVPEPRTVTVVEHDVEPEQPQGVLFVDRELRSDEVRVGENVSVDVTMMNIGDDAEEFTLEAALVDELALVRLVEDEQTESIVFEPGETTVTMNLTDDVYSNDVEVVVNDRIAGIVDLVARDTYINHAELEELEVTAGAEVNATIEVANWGNLEAEDTLTIRVDGVPVETVSVTVAAIDEQLVPGTETVDVALTFDDAGEYTVTANVTDDGYWDGWYDADLGTVIVESGPEPSVDDYTEEDGTVQTDGLRGAIDDWRGGSVDTDLLRDVIDAWRSGEPVV